MWQKAGVKGFSLLLSMACLSLWFPVPTLAATGPQIQEFPGPTKATPPLNVVAGPDGSIWFSEDKAFTVGRYNSKSGRFQNYELTCSRFCPTLLTIGGDNNPWLSTGPGSFNRFSTQTGERTRLDDPLAPVWPPMALDKNALYPISRGGDGNLWYMTPETIGRMTPAGETADFSLPPETTNGVINALTAGSDGNVWFSMNTGFIGNITPSGDITTFSTVRPGAAMSQPIDLITGPDGNLWFIDAFTHQIGRMILQGAIATYALPKNLHVNTLKSLTSGPDGNLWFIDTAGNQLLSMTLQGVFSAYQIPTPASQPGSLTVDSDGDLWFSETGANKIGRFTPPSMSTQRAQKINGRLLFQEIAVPEQNKHPWFILPGPGGDIWFSEYDTNEIGRITTSGRLLKDYTTAPVSDLDEQLRDMARGKDGNLWFAENTSIGRMTPTGQLSMFPTPSSSMARSLSANSDGNVWFLLNNTQFGNITPQEKFTIWSFPANSSIYNPDNYVGALTAGPDGKLWITERLANKIDRLTTQGKMTEFSIPSAPPFRYGNSSFPGLITSGSDGNLWFLEVNGNKLGRITPAGIFSEFPVDVALGEVAGMTFGSDGNLWLAAQDKVIRVTQRGLTTTYPLASNSFIQHITSGPDGNIWFTEQGADKIGRILLSKP
jgi:streptogramin lyase